MLHINDIEFPYIRQPLFFEADVCALNDEYSSLKEARE
jgi:hypothetical protein